MRGWYATSRELHNSHAIPSWAQHAQPHVHVPTQFTCASLPCRPRRRQDSERPAHGSCPFCVSPAALAMHIPQRWAGVGGWSRIAAQSRILRLTKAGLVHVKAYMCMAQSAALSKEDDAWLRLVHYIQRITLYNSETYSGVRVREEPRASGSGSCSVVQCVPSPAAFRRFGDPFPLSAALFVCHRP